MWCGSGWGTSNVNRKIEHCTVYNTCMSQTLKLTIELPEPVYRLLSKTAELTHQPLETIATQSITGNLPPSVETAPLEVQADLLAMQSLSIEQLLQIANAQVPSETQERHLLLLEQNSLDALTAIEQEELKNLRLAADQLMLRKAYAWAVLRWRGQRIPALYELPVA